MCHGGSGHAPPAGPQPPTVATLAGRRTRWWSLGRAGQGTPCTGGRTFRHRCRRGLADRVLALGGAPRGVARCRGEPAAAVPPRARRRPRVLVGAASGSCCPVRGPLGPRAPEDGTAGGTAASRPGSGAPTGPAALRPQWPAGQRQDVEVDRRQPDRRRAPRACRRLHCQRRVPGGARRGLPPLPAGPRRAVAGHGSPCDRAGVATAPRRAVAARQPRVGHVRRAARAPRRRPRPALGGAQPDPAAEGRPGG